MGISSSVSAVFADFALCLITFGGFCSAGLAIDFEIILGVAD